MSGSDTKRPIASSSGAHEQVRPEGRHLHVVRLHGTVSQADDDSTNDANPTVQGSFALTTAGETVEESAVEIDQNEIAGSAIKPTVRSWASYQPSLLTEISRRALEKIRGIKTTHRTNEILSSEFRELVELARDDLYASNEVSEINLKRIRELQSKIQCLKLNVPNLWRKRDLLRLMDCLERSKRRERYRLATEWISMTAMIAVSGAADVALLLFMDSLVGERVTAHVIAAMGVAIMSTIGMIAYLLARLYFYWRQKKEERSFRQQRWSALAALAATVSGRELVR